MRAARVILAVLLLAATVLPIVTALEAAPAEARGMGSTPLDDIRFWAENKRACGLGRDQLAAMMMAVTYPEAGATGEQAPSPMTLSRYDTAARLFAFADKNTPWRSAFWHPGIGMWAFDSSGGWNLTAAGAINTFYAAEQAATVMASRWCANQSLNYVWAPWFACASSSACLDIYNNIFDGTSLRNITLHPGVTREGGMETRTCTVSGAPVTCWYVNPARAQGANWWVNPAAGPSPIAAPFYVVSVNGREARYWLPEDTGFLRAIKADKPITADARNSLVWSSPAELCDVSAGRGDCGSGGRVANTPWGPRVAVPFGSLDVASPSVGAVDVTGWAVDPDTNDSIEVHVYVDGQILGVLQANGARPDVAVAVPGYGDRHGFAARLGRVAGGVHQVCAYAINVGPLGDQNPQIGCRTVAIAAGPVGTFDDWVVSSPGIRVKGWAIDADTTAAIGVHVYVDGQFAGQGVADKSRPDVGAAFAWAGANRGYELEAAATPGLHTVCAYGINAGPGANTLLACRTVDVPNRAPFGSLDAVTRTGGSTVRVLGWTIDPDLVFPTEVHVYVDDGFAVALPASVSRPDVAAAFPFYGQYHGFDVTLAAPPGARICVYAINAGPGWGNPLLGCRSVA